MFVCCAAFLCFHFSLWIFMLSCYVVLLSCLLSFAVLPVSFCNDFIVPVLCLIRAPFSHPFVSFWCGPVWLYFLKSSTALIDISSLFALLFRSVSFESFSVDPFFFHASLLFESPRRKPGWRFTAGSPLSCSAQRVILLRSDRPCSGVREDR